jgi:hypothetical protein
VIPLVNLSVSGCYLDDARCITALLRQHRPGDPSQLVGESGSAVATVWRDALIAVNCLERLRRPGMRFLQHFFLAMASIEYGIGKR